MSNPCNHTTVWNTVPCTSLRKDKVVKHSQSQMHKIAALKEERRLSVSAEFCGGVIEASFQRQIELNREAIRGALQALYWLAKEEVAHTTKYESLLKLAKTWGHDFLSVLQVGKNAMYTSDTIIQEFLQVLADVIFKEQLRKLGASQFFSLLIQMRQLTSQSSRNW